MEIDERLTVLISFEFSGLVICTFIRLIGCQ